MTFVGVPAVVSTADELLPAARELIDRETVALEAHSDVTVSCAANCNACCEHSVVVSPAETRAIRTAVAELPGVTQAAIEDRARQVLDRVALELPGDPTRRETLDRFFPRDYYALQEPCPLLIDGQCSVRSVRPLVCREYLMSSAPEHCFDPTLEHAVRIRRRRNVSGGFQAVSSRFGEGDRQLLPVALLAAPESAGANSLSGPKLARLLSTTQ